MLAQITVFTLLAALPNINAAAIPPYHDPGFAVKTHLSDNRRLASLLEESDDPIIEQGILPTHTRRTAHHCSMGTALVALGLFLFLVHCFYLFCRSLARRSAQSVMVAVKDRMKRGRSRTPRTIHDEKHFLDTPVPAIADL